MHKFCGLWVCQIPKLLVFRFQCDNNNKYLIQLKLQLNFLLHRNGPPSQSDGCSLDPDLMAISKFPHNVLLNFFHSTSIRRRRRRINAEPVFLKSRVIVIWPLSKRTPSRNEDNFIFSVVQVVADDYLVAVPFKSGTSLWNNEFWIRF